VDAVVFCQAPKHKVENYRDTYFQGTMNLLKTFDKTAPQKIIFISSTSVYGVTDGAWVDESTPPGGNFETQEDAQNAQWLLNAENLVLASGIPGIIFRLGGIYGPGRHRLRLLKEGKMKPSFTDLYTNRIHRDDIVGGLELLLEKGKAGEVYLGVDDDPATQREFYTWLCQKLNLPVSGESDNGAAKTTAHGSNKRCSNRKIKALGLQLKYPTFREGYAELLKEVS
jgi:nucleoside-diphosphate-sugar epimerase